MNKNQLAEKRYEDKTKKEIRLKNKKHTKQNKKMEKIKKTITIININYKI